MFESDALIRIVAVAAPPSEITVVFIFTELLTCPKALMHPEKETPLSGRRANGTSVSEAMLHNIIDRFESKALSKGMQYE